MAGRIDARLKELGVELPTPTEPKVAKILNYKRSGNLLYVSGQVPRVDGEIGFIGKVGREFTLEQGQQAARISALNVLANVRAALESPSQYSLSGVAILPPRPRVIQAALL
jgi:enamine deaminase RidA (YjgF/YER057c/UK114 family)